MKETQITVSFNCVPDRTVFDVDGKKTDGGAITTLSVAPNVVSHFVRFDAYKGVFFYIQIRSLFVLPEKLNEFYMKGKIRNTE